ncbi:cobra-like protein 1 [Senna tora]|uniref:Cobra-like protein 1 n=1 Tax=Senna tora TaxID=362788 RepID=A0A835CGC4_9FABA|nr:cobra-like protein 1 [Senna tora]
MLHDFEGWKWVREKDPFVWYIDSDRQDGVVLFWGIDYYNDELLQSDKDQLGYVTTEVLMKKDLEVFTLRNGWGFPRTIYFNGDNCEMPLPDTFPMLPNGCSKFGSFHSNPLLLLFIYLFLTTNLVIFWS